MSIAFTAFSFTWTSTLLDIPSPIEKSKPPGYKVISFQSSVNNPVYPESIKLISVVKGVISNLSGKCNNVKNYMASKSSIPFSKNYLSFLIQY